MKFLKFVKNYFRLKKAISELEYREALAESNMKKLEKSSLKYSSTMAAYHRKKIEFYKGEMTGYKNSILILENFIDTGNLPEIIDSLEEK